jgi:phosphoenolpyruvate synthase/pyruvate phosphate dikinase
LGVKGILAVDLSVRCVNRDLHSAHAAIVARELGIPAVVGCGDATVRLRTGDRVLVDGERGTIAILDQSAAR